MANVTAFYAAPQVPDDARRLWDASCVSAGYDQGLELPIQAGRGFGASLLLAREWEVPGLEGRLAEAIEASYEPTWDRELGEFTWGMGLDEPHPRGQFNAFLAAAEAGGPGRWTALSAAPLEPCPQVVDVDFPSVALTRAEWVDSVLHLRLAPLNEDPSLSTSFRVIGLPPGGWDILGPDGVSIESRPSEVVIEARLAHADLRLRPETT